jgi:hypothetical protein
MASPAVADGRIDALGFSLRVRVLTPDGRTLAPGQEAELEVVLTCDVLPVLVELDVAVDSPLYIRMSEHHSGVAAAGRATNWRATLSGEPGNQAVQRNVLGVDRPDASPTRAQVTLTARRRAADGGGWSQVGKTLVLTVDVSG